MLPLVALRDQDVGLVWSEYTPLEINNEKYSYAFCEFLAEVHEQNLRDRQKGLFKWKAQLQDGSDVVSAWIVFEWKINEEGELVYYVYLTSDQGADTKRSRWLASGIVKPAEGATLRQDVCKKYRNVGGAKWRIILNQIK